MKTLSILLSTVIYIVISDNFIGLLTSEYTSDIFKQQIEANLQGILLSSKSTLSIYWVEVNLSNMNNNWIIPKSFLDNNIKIILDVSLYPSYSQYLASQTSIDNFLHIVLERPINSLIGEVPSPNTIYAYQNYIPEAKALYDLIMNFNWENLALIYDQQLNNLQMAKEFKKLVENTIKLKDELILDNDDVFSYTTLSHRLESTTRDSGARIIVVMVNPVLAGMLLRAADESVMGGAGYAWIFSSGSMLNIGEIAKNSHADIPPEKYGILKTGAIGLMTPDQVYLDSEPLGTLQALITISNQALLSVTEPNSLTLYDYFLSNYEFPSLPYQLHFDETGIKKVDYFLYNLKNFYANKVGKWDSKKNIFVLDQENIITWPGLSTDVPDDKVPIMKICLLYPQTDAQGKIDPEGELVKKGFMLAINQINTQKLLGDYRVDVTYKDTLLSNSLASVTIKSLASFNILAYVGPYGSDLAKSYARALSAYEDPKPLISYQASESLLSDSTIYSRFLRTVQPDGLQAVAVAMQINVQNWKRIGVIYSDDTTGQGIYTSFQSNVKTLDIIIENPETFRSIFINTNEDGSLSSSTKSRIDDVLSEIVKKQLKIIVYLGNSTISAEIAKQAHKKELYGNDYSWIGSMWLDSTLQKTIEQYYKNDEENIYKVLNGAFGLAYRSPQGDEGKIFESNFKEAYSESYSIFSLLAYDTAYLLANTISGMISKGEDFTSGKELMDSLRAADFVGASGKIKFSEGTNDRSAYGYAIGNMQNKKFINIQVYDPLDPNMFTNVSNTSIIWGGEASKSPSDSWSVNYDCPFAQHMSRVSGQGVAIVISIGAFLVIITLGLSYYSYKKWRQVEMMEIREPVVRNWKDTMAEVQIGVEFFQFIAIAPTFTSLKIVIEAASNIFMLDIMKVAQSSKADYWVLLSAVCALCYAWFILVILIMTNAETWLQKLPMCQRLLSMMNTLFLPFYGNTMFLPSLALLLDVFVCDHTAQGREYVWRDCYMQCWGDKHSPYIAMSAIAIITYEPVAAFSRPLWQQAKTGLNIKIKPFFLLLKTCMQILLIAVGKSLQGISPLAHGIVFSILFTSFTIFTYKLRPFNYGRCNLWEFSSLVAVSYMSILATLSYSGNSSHIGWFVALIVGWALLGAGTIFFQRKYFPNLLVAPAEAKSKRKVYNMLEAQDVSQNEDLSKQEIPSQSLNQDSNNKQNLVLEIRSKSNPVSEEHPKSSESDSDDEVDEGAIPI
ncbi:hypothetical protein SteCoe_2602 [Stentor coeruleus]|uniref:Receptor ligand binding region domain-containing protein n=1 Tax=Stentor coeruleus TaxID=5963 RepID=A0A1R2CZ48_9CILI|nr:hypothetical protein SteCoe_2602 [Stentor coeruleus]